MGGSSSTSTVQPRIGGFAIQKSLLGVAIARCWGTARFGGNLLEYRDFKAIEHTSSESAGGKGGEMTQTNTTWTYEAAVMIALCAGPVAGVIAVYRDKSVFSDSETDGTALEQAGLSFAPGPLGQAPWGYLLTNHEAEALGYSGLAYVYAAGYQLNDSAGLQNHTFEVQSLVRVPGLPDANPADIVDDFLNHPVAGVPGWQSDWLGDMTDYRAYCLAQNLLLSPVLTEQRPGAEFLTEIATASNSEVVVSAGRLRFVPYADQDVMGNGVTHVPDLTPLYDLGPDEFEERLRLSRKDPKDVYNVAQVEFNNRQNQYNPETMPAPDQAHIEQFGKRKEDPVKLSCICEPSIARTLAQLRLQRGLGNINTYTGRLPWSFVGLEPMDLVTLTEEELGLERQLARVTDIDEDDGGLLTVTFEEVHVGAAGAAQYPVQPGQGVGVNFNVSPGSVSPPVMFNPPDSLLDGRLQIWLAVAGSSPHWGGCEVWASQDGDTYQRIGTVTGRARYGVTTTALPAAADPDLVNSLGVNLTVSAGVLQGATPSDVDAAITLCWVGGELIAYRDATLTGPSRYTLGGVLRRGLYGSPIAAHAPGAPFVRLDASLFKYDFAPGQLGSTIFVKFASFNVFRKAMQSLDALPAYEVILSPARAAPEAAGALQLVGPFEGTYFTVSWAAGARGERSKVRVKAGGTVVRSVETTSTAFSYQLEDAEADGVVRRDYSVEVVTTNVAGDAAPITLAVHNTAPAPVVGILVTPAAGGAVVAWPQSPEVDRAGYLLVYSNTSGFDPSAGAGVTAYDGPALTATITGLAAGATYYGRVAAYDTWAKNPSELHFSSQFSFVPT
ncbi:hypothetical protein GCM10007242_45530 [Pigmentiphaga litoralis]|uniref:phage tail protein n=1 Tax=Pigmentiphaga litoralis TaxID=516702 RepID=UPI001679DC82|nr:phage tail protein [Pigmentiphaga litoralis]GGX33275.1 hypothetical protein GCM10007242_45530 [Pigmentiphaga litoralis]